MILWFLFAVLSALVIGLMLRPLFRDEGTHVDGHGHQLAVYRDQIAEIDSDRARGLINAEEAEAARVELARRLLRDAKDGVPGEHKEKETETIGRGNEAPYASSTLAYVLGSMIAVGSVGIYLLVGQPHMMGIYGAKNSAQPTAERDDDTTIRALVAKVERRLREKPDDGKGWDVVAPVYFGLRRYDDAVLAYDRAIALLGGSPKRLSGLGRSLLGANGGVITERARKTYSRLLALDPGNIEAQLWLARANEQDGDAKAAIESYRAILESAPEDARFVKMVRERIAVLENSLGTVTPEDDVSARDKNTAQERATQREVGGESVGDMRPQAGGPSVNEMVASLAKRLERDGSDFNGWVRLIRSYMVLGREDDAKTALSKAQAAFREDEKKKKMLAELADKFGLVGQ